jgi:hypothetical protein
LRERSLDDNAKFYESRIVSAQGEAQEWKESSHKGQVQVNTLEQAKAQLESDLDHEKANWKDTLKISASNLAIFFAPNIVSRESTSENLVLIEKVTPI